MDKTDEFVETMSENLLGDKHPDSKQVMRFSQKISDDPMRRIVA